MAGKHRAYLPTLLLAALNGGQLSAQPPTAEGAPVEAGPRRVEAVIDYSRPDVGDQIGHFAAMLGPHGSIVHLELRIVPSDSEGANYRVNELDGEASTPLNCEGPARRDGEGYSFEFNPDFNHLILTIRHGNWIRAPFSTVACITNSRTGGTDFVISGYYWTSSLHIPTAVDVELRPLTALPRRRRGDSPPPPAR